jgi:hypothetical protein
VAAITSGAFLRPIERHAAVLALGRSVVCGVMLASFAMPAAQDHARRDWRATATYWVTVREIDGVDSVPAHLLGHATQRCTGEMSVSIPGGALRVFVIALVDGSEALVRFRADRRNVSCAPHDYVTRSLGPPPMSGIDYTHLCDAPPGRDEPEPAAEPAVLRSFPTLAALRIDVRPGDGD